MMITEVQEEKKKIQEEKKEIKELVKAYRAISSVKRRDIARGFVAGVQACEPKEKGQ